MVTIILIYIAMAVIAAALAAAIVVEVMLQLVSVETVFLNWPFLIGITYDISVKFHLGEAMYEFLGHLDREETGVDDGTQFRRSIGETTESWRKRMRRKLQQEGHSAEDIERRIRHYSSVERPRAFRFASEVPSKGSASGFVLFFSPHRSILTTETTGSQASLSPVAQSLSDRRFNLLQAAEWWLAQVALATEGGRTRRRVEALKSAIEEFLPPSIQGVRPRPRRGESPPTLTAIKDHKRFDLFDLSDGERGMIALVLEIARRLSLAYPDLDDPTKEGAACILIDEIELHLHPAWQRDVLRWLERGFPKCQFIVTTHSPQVIGEVETDRVHLLTEEGIESPRQSFGMDAAWLLRNVMDADDRSKSVLEDLRKVDRAIANKDFKSALEEIERIEAEVGGPFDRLVSLRTQAEIMERLSKQ